MLTRKLFRYAIDKVNGRFMAGWCFHRLKKTQPVVVRVVADNEFLGSVTNNVYRKDLKRERLHPTGVCGFIFNFPKEIDLGQYEFLYLYSGNAKRPFARIACGEVAILRPDAEKNIFFMHIPKTAGTSLNSFVRSCYDYDDYALHIERLAPEERVKLAGTKHYIAGHLPLSEIDNNLDISTYELYTLLREPYRHLHSHLNYVRCVHTGAEEEVHYYYKHNETIKGMANRLNRMNFGSDSEIRFFVENLQGFELNFFDNIQTRYFLDYQPEKVSSADFENARNNIDRFQLVGLTEQYKGFLDRFCQDMGLLSQTQSEQSNKSDDYQLFDHTLQSTRSALFPLVEADLLLYNYVAEKFWA